MDTAKLTAAVEMVECENGQKVLVKGLPQPYRSAPELLEALRATLEHAEDETAIRAGAQCTLCHSYRQMIRAAIAAATGEG